MTDAPDVDTLLQWLETMWTIRFFDEHVVDSFRKGLFTGSTHTLRYTQLSTGGGGGAGSTN